MPVYGIIWPQLQRNGATKAAGKANTERYRLNKVSRAAPSTLSISPAAVKLTVERLACSWLLLLLQTFVSRERKIIVRTCFQGLLRNSHGLHSPPQNIFFHDKKCFIFTFMSEHQIQTQDTSWMYTDFILYASDRHQQSTLANFPVS